MTTAQQKPDHWIVRQEIRVPASEFIAAHDPRVMMTDSKGKPLKATFIVVPTSKDVKARRGETRTVKMQAKRYGMLVTWRKDYDGWTIQL